MKHGITLQIILIILLYANCNPSPHSAQEIVGKAIEIAGGDRFTHSYVTFDFRDHSYGIKRDSGLFEYTRKTYLSEDSVMVDLVHNYGFKRMINDTMVSVPDSMAKRYKASVNSVVYFFSLPFGLNDPAVNKRYSGEKIVDGKNYHKIKVWFDKEGGGQDHQDEYYYWVNQANHKVDYLAYSYETDGGGMRFRKAYNERYINGIRVVDYINFIPSTDTVELSHIDDAFINADLTELSRIENDNVEAHLLPTQD